MLRAALLAAGVSLWPAVNYDLRLRLDETEHFVSGTAVVSFKNTSEKELTELWFHLYMNAFRNGETLFMREPPGAPQGSRSGRRLRRPGSIDVGRVTWLRDGSNLWDKADPHSPGDPKDGTDVRLPLPSPIQPGESVTLSMQFETRLPELVERTGFEDDFHLISGFYPKLARLSPEGDFDHFPYHPLAEFSANFGSYRVELDVPASHKIGTTGTLTSRRRTGDRAHYESVAIDVHDFAWTSWPGFSEESRTLGETKVTVLVPEQATDLKRDYFNVLAPLLEHYGKRFGPYPHPTLTVVHPPIRAAPAGGMEYPRLITTGGSRWLGLFGVRFLELVTAHELGHQWFQGLVASSEYRAPWLDESLTTLAEFHFLEEHFGAGSLVATPFLTIAETSGWRFQGFETQVKNALLSAPEYGDFGTLARTIYARAPMALETTRRVFGRAAFDRAMKDYATRFRFQHPDSKDIFEVFGSHLGGEASRAMKALLAGEGSGYRLERPTTHSRGDRSFRTSVQVVPEGSLILPVRLEARLADGQMMSFPVRGETRVSFDHTVPLEAICVDPDESIVIDPDRLNNRFRPRQALSQLSQKTAFSSFLALVLSILFA